MPLNIKLPLPQVKALEIDIESIMNNVINQTADEELPAFARPAVNWMLNHALPEIEKQLNEKLYLALASAGLIENAA